MQTKEEREREVYLRSVNIGSQDFLKDLSQVHYLWQLYYSAGAEVNNPHPENPNAKTFKDWLIHLTPEEHEANVERYWIETGLGGEIEII